MHPGEEAAEEGRDGGGGPQAEAGHHTEQEHRALQQRDQASQVQRSKRYRNPGGRVKFNVKQILYFNLC